MRGRYLGNLREASEALASSGGGGALGNLGVRNPPVEPHHKP